MHPLHRSSLTCLLLCLAAVVHAGHASSGLSATRSVHISFITPDAWSAKDSTVRMRTPERGAAERVFVDAGMRGCFVVHDVRANRTIRVNASRCARRFPPASTFKIPNALISLETGVIADERTVIAWDSVARAIPDWNRDHDLASAMRVSAVPVYQELARRVGEARMRDWVRRIGYGNRDIRGGIDRFWLDGRLRISADEQIRFLSHLATGALPFSPRTMEIVRRILTLDARGDAVLHAKTGWAIRGTWNVGWFVGWVERGADTYVFALNIEPVNGLRDDFTAQRRILAETLLRMCGVWE